MQAIFRRASYVACVLAKRVPLAKVSGLRKPKCFSHWRPHAVCSNYKRGANNSNVVNVNTHEIAMRVINCSKRVALKHTDACIFCLLYECVIKFDARGDRGKLTSAMWQWHIHFTSTWRAQPHVFTHRPTGNRCRVELEFFKNAQCAGSQTITTAFVAGKHRFVDNHYVVSRLLQCERGCNSCWPCTNDCDITLHRGCGVRQSFGHGVETRVCRYESLM